MTSPTRYFLPKGDADRADLAAFVRRARRIDDSGVFRAKRRGDGLTGLWVRTGFDVLATRAVVAEAEPSDLVCDAATVEASLASGAEKVDAGFALPAAWQGALPPEAGFTHLDDVPARDVIALSRKGAEVARTSSGALGPAPSLLDQEVLDVTGDDGTSARISMRAVFALTAMGFVRDARGREISEDSALDAIDPAEPIRVRASSAWVRIDARFGAVYQRSAAMNLSVL
ncbi:MAG: hypothetical protein QM658_03695 [Gordonia sp. (in: high G+C Gram-positive bacteria)]